MSEILQTNEPTKHESRRVLTDKQIGRILRAHGIEYIDADMVTPGGVWRSASMIAHDDCGDDSQTRWIVVSGWTLGRLRDWLGY